jgi:hypothetical protein
VLSAGRSSIASHDGPGAELRQTAIEHGREDMGPADLLEFKSMARGSASSAVRHGPVVSTTGHRTPPRLSEGSTEGSPLLIPAVAASGVTGAAGQTANSSPEQAGTTGRRACRP